MPTHFDGFYQLGFVARDRDAATAMLSERYGITDWRRKSADWADTGHAYAGDIMIEVIAITALAPVLYHDYLPATRDAVLLHHHGFRVTDPARWAAINADADARGIATDVRGAAMNGDLNFLYVDTRADLGIYSEYVMLTGAAKGLYDDVPRN